MMSISDSCISIPRWMYDPHQMHEAADCLPWGYRGWKGSCQLVMRVYLSGLWVGGTWSTLNTWCCRVRGPVQWGVCQGHMHGSIAICHVIAVPVHMVLLLEHVGLLLRAYACGGNKDLVKVVIGISWNCTWNIVCDHMSLCSLDDSGYDCVSTVCWYLWLQPSCLDPCPLVPHFLSFTFGTIFGMARR